MKTQSILLTMVCYLLIPIAGASQTLVDSSRPWSVEPLSASEMANITGEWNLGQRLLNKEAMKGFEEQEQEAQLSPDSTTSEAKAGGNSDFYSGGGTDPSGGTPTTTTTDTGGRRVIKKVPVGGTDGGIITSNVGDYNATRGPKAGGDQNPWDLFQVGVMQAIVSNPVMNANLIKAGPKIPDYNMTINKNFHFQKNFKQGLRGQKLLKQLNPQQLNIPQIQGSQFSR